MTAEWKPLASCYRASVDIEMPPEACMVYYNNNNMGPQLPGCPLFSASAFDCDYPSHDVVVVGNTETKEYMLVGAVTAFRSLTYLTVRRRSGRFTCILVEQPEIPADGEPERMVVKKGNDWRELLKDYAMECAAAMGVPPIHPKENLSGYCTWYYYYAAVTEQDFLDNLDALAAHPELPYSHSVAQIDDGYQPFHGDWLEQDASWPTPIQKVAATATEKGLIPGIWLMPMLASTSSRVFKEHPDWFVKNEQGEPHVFSGWSAAPNNHWICLDATLPAVQEHLTHVFKTFWSWGFRYFKMDGLGYGLPVGRRHDPNATAVSAFRLALETIRKAVPEAHLLGCCAPFMACLGYVDSARVSNDTARVWGTTLADNCDTHPGGGSIKGAWHASMANWWKFDRWFRADPDTLMARQDNAQYTVGEARISVLAGILSGVTITSDNLATIAPDRLELLALASRTRLEDVMPLEWKPYHWCQTWGGTINGHTAVAFVNDANATQTFKLADFGLADGGDEILQKLGPVVDTITVEPHDAALVVAR